MAINIDLRYSAELTETVVSRVVRNNLYTGDADAHTFRVACYRDGERVDMNGATVAASFVRGNGETLAFAGFVENNEVCATLPETCYAEKTQFALFLRAVQGSTKNVVLAVTGVVAQSATDQIIDPGSVITRSFDDLIDEIERTAATIPADYTDLSDRVQLNNAVHAQMDGVLPFEWERGSIDGSGTDNNAAANKNQYTRSKNSIHVTPGEMIYLAEGAPTLASTVLLTWYKTDGTYLGKKTATATGEVVPNDAGLVRVYYRRITSGTGPLSGGEGVTLYRNGGVLRDELTRDMKFNLDLMKAENKATYSMRDPLFEPKAVRQAAWRGWNWDYPANKCPMNSWPAYEAAVAGGADMLWLAAVSVSKDGVFYVIHDEALQVSNGVIDMDVTPKKDASGNWPAGAYPTYSYTAAQLDALVMGSTKYSYADPAARRHPVRLDAVLAWAKGNGISVGIRTGRLPSTDGDTVWNSDYTSLTNRQIWEGFADVIRKAGCEKDIFSADGNGVMTCLRKYLPDCHLQYHGAMKTMAEGLAGVDKVRAFGGSTSINIYNAGWCREVLEYAESQGVRTFVAVSDAAGHAFDYTQVPPDYLITTVDDGYGVKAAVARKINDISGEVVQVKSIISKQSESIAEKIDKPTISDNNKFPRAKNGDVEWVEQGLPTDAQTATAVQNWLNSHPEATTTVQDGSLTYKKFKKEEVLFVSPEMFGAVGDGVTDDTDSVQRAVDTGLPVCFERKYMCNSEIYLGQRNIYFFGCGTIIYGRNVFNTTFGKWLFTNTKENTSIIPQKYAVVDGLSFEGMDGVKTVDTTFTTFGCGLLFIGYECVKVLNCTFKNFYGTPVIACGCSDVRIEGNIFSNIGNSHELVNTTNSVSVYHKYYDQGLKQNVEKRTMFASIKNNYAYNIRDEFALVVADYSIIENNVAVGIGQYFVESLLSKGERNIIISNNKIDKLATTIIRLDTSNIDGDENVSVTIKGNIVKNHLYAYTDHHVKNKNSLARPELVFISGKCCNNVVISDNVAIVNNNFEPLNTATVYLYLNGGKEVYVRNNRFYFNVIQKPYTYMVSNSVADKVVSIINNDFVGDSSMMLSDRVVLSQAENTYIIGNSIYPTLSRSLVCLSASKNKRVFVDGNYVNKAYCIVEIFKESNVELCKYTNNIVDVCTYPFQNSQTEKTVKLLQSGNYFANKTETINVKSYFASYAENTWGSF